MSIPSPMQQHPGATLTDAGRAAPTDVLQYWEAALAHETELAVCFDQLAVELLDLGCASSIVVRSRVAADECRSHAEMCHRIASLHGDVPFKRSRRRRRIKSRDYATLVLIAVNTFRESLLDEVLRVEGLVQGSMLQKSDIQKRLMGQLIVGKRQHLDLAREIVSWAVALDSSVATALSTVSKQHSTKSLDEHVREFALPGTFDCAPRALAFTQACEDRRREAFEWLDLTLAPHSLV